MKIKERAVMKEDVFDSKLDFYRAVTEVKSTIKDDITADFIFARLGDKDKTFVMEMVENGYFGKKMLDRINIKSCKWVWNTDRWQLIPVSDDTFDKMTTLANNFFSMFMIKVFMIAILNRNVSNNYLIKTLTGVIEEETKEEEQKKEKQIIEKALERMKPDHTQKR